MITNKEIDFAAYNQSFEFVELGFAGKLLVKLLRTFKINTIAYKLDFFERMLNFLKIVGLEALSNNLQTDIFTNGKIKLSSLNKADNMSQSFVEFLFQFEILTLENEVFEIKPEYEELLKDGVIKKVIQVEDISFIQTLSKPIQALISDYLFVRDLVNKYNKPTHQLQFVKQNTSKWEALINEKQLDYEVRLCETLYNLVYLQIPNKIKSPFSEDYYTESGQNAFKNFTRFIFPNYLKKIKPQENLQVLDLGCGYGNYIDVVQKTYPKASIDGIEINPKVHAVTKAKFADNDRVAILNQDFFDFETAKKYDAILVNYVFFYFNSEEKQRLIEKAKQLLTADGSIIICQYFSGIEAMKAQLAQKQKDNSLAKKIEMYYSDKVLYTNTLWNDAVDTFSEAAKWNEFKRIASTAGLQITSMTNADKFYYSLFIELKR